MPRCRGAFLSAGRVEEGTCPGLYCNGCEQFLDGDSCPEHPEPPTPVAEENWFLRLSRYQARLLDALESRELDIVPAARRNEVLAFVRAHIAAEAGVTLDGTWRPQPSGTRRV